MKVSQRGMLLVGFPLICQLVFVAVLMLLLVRIEAEISKESHSRELIGAINTLNCQSVEAIYTLNIESQMQMILSDQAGLAAIDQFSRNIEAVSKLASQDAHQRKQLDLLNSSGVEIIKAFQSVRNEFHKQPRDTSRITSINQKMMIHAGTFQGVLTDMVTREEEVLAKSPGRSEKLRWQVIFTLAAALAASVSSALIFALLFAKGIRQPLLRIAENSKLFSERKELLPQMTGRDEISALDRLLHVVAKNSLSVVARETGMIRNAADMICSLNSDGIIVFTNPYVTRILGYEESEVIGKNILDFVVSDDCLNVDQHLRNCRESSDMKAFELRMNRSDGSQIETRWSVIWSNSDSSLFCVVHDITKQKNIERLKEDFVNMVTHDLRSPLSSMLGSMTLILEGVKGPISSEVRLEVEDASKDIETLMVLINDLLDFQKLKTGEIQLHVETASIQALLNDAVSLVRKVAASKGVKVEMPAGDWTAECDRNKILQVVVNLLGNAIKFSPQDGAVKIEVTEKSNCLEISIIDSGPGIPETFRERIFEAFEQLPYPQKKEGSGLGLAICKMIVEAHNGTIGVRSYDASGQQFSGSAFWFDIPIVNTLGLKS